MDIMILKDSIAEVIVIVIGLVITRYLVPYLKERYGAERIKNVYDLIVKAVQAAEMLFPDSGSGAEKKQYVIDYIAQKGIVISEADLDIFIESAVKILNIIKAEVSPEVIPTV